MSRLAVAPHAEFPSFRYSPDDGDGPVAVEAPLDDVLVVHGAGLYIEAGSGGRYLTPDNARKLAMAILDIVGWSEERRAELNE